MKQKSEPKPIDDGGYAFPGRGDQLTEHGMKLRDHFAGLAMQGLYAGWPQGALISPAADAELAYRIADAMIKARQVKGD
jgi:hypothetical protein